MPASFRCLIATCRLHDVDPHTYLVDVVQRVGEHPASRVAELTPRLWKQYFGDNPLRSDLDKCAIARTTIGADVPGNKPSWP